MNNKDMAAGPLPLSSRANRHRSLVIAAIITTATFYLGGCDGGGPQQGQYQPGGGYNTGGTFYGNDGSSSGNVYPDNSYPYDDGGIAPDRFDPKPPEGPYSPNLNMTPN